MTHFESAHPTVENEKHCKLGDDRGGEFRKLVDNARVRGREREGKKTLKKIPVW